MSSFQYHQEVYRKLIHLSSLWMPAAIWFLDTPTALLIFAACMALVLVYEVVRKQNHALARLLERFCGIALRPDEKEGYFKPSGAIYVLAGAFICTALFPRLAAVAAMAMSLTGDTAAALIGRKFGRHKILNKSLEGSLAFFATALATALPVGLPAKAAMVTALTGTLVELISKKLYIDDNLTVPFAIGAVIVLL